MGRSILAIVTGFVVIAALSIGTDFALGAMGVYPRPPAPLTDTTLLVLSQVYVAVYAIFGCWLTAAMAPDRPMRHALILGALGLIFNLAAASANAARVPMWYVVAAIVLVMPYAWIGGWLRERQLAGRAPRIAS